MRYQDWDVLLFPDGSKIPIQEFKTTCHVAKESSYHASSSGFANTTYPGAGPLSLIPVLTSFVGSLKHGEKFRVSVHSWQRPKSSRQLESYMSPDDAAMFEARVYIDGLLVATHLFDHRTQWPVVIDANRRFEQEGHTEALRFPPFHPSILKQEHWEPNESFGRIKVVITEGVNLSYNPSLPGRVGFDRFRDVITFYFQHANLDVLQYSGIAWPNPGMWNQAPRGIHRTAPIGTKPTTSLDYDAHAHSPRRPMDTYIPPTPIPCYNDPVECAAKTCTHTSHYASMFRQPGPPLHHSQWAPSNAAQSSGSRNPMTAAEDPFMGPPPMPSGTKRWSSIYDMPMSDYISSKSDHSRAHTEMSGIAFPANNFERTMNEAAVEEIVKALSPLKRNELIEALSPGRDAQATIFSRNPPLPDKPDSALQTDQSRVSPHSLINARRASLDVNPSINQSRSISASSRPDHPLSKYPPPRYSHSPSDSIQSRKEAAVIVLSDDPDASLDSSTMAKNSLAFVSNEAVAGRDPLTENSKTNRQRSASNASKRKRSLSLKKDGVGKASPATGKAKPLTLLDSAYSPMKSNDSSPHSGGVPLRQ